MRNAISGLAALSLAAALPAAAQAIGASQTAKPDAVSLHGDPGAPDISGLWMGTAFGIPGRGVISNYNKSADGRPPSYWGPWPLPYTPAYQKMQDERAEAAKRGVAIGDIGARCLPFGMPYILVGMNYPHEVVQTPGQVTLYPFGTFPITIWTDGRPHPANLQPSYNGHSIGHWQGDTLFVDTVGITAATPIDTARNPHSAKIHVTWFIPRVAADYVHVKMTLIDEDAFTQPVTITNIWERKSGPEWQVLDDQSCFENNKDTPPPKSAAGFIKF